MSNKLLVISQEEATKVDEKADELDNAELAAVKASMLKWVWGVNRSEAGYLIVGMIGACVEGLVWPIYAILLADIINVLLDPDHTAGDIAVWCYAFLVLAAVVFIVTFLKLAFITRASEVGTANFFLNRFNVAASIVVQVAMPNVTF